MKQYKTIIEFLTDLEPKKREQVELLRKIILKVTLELTEHIKWNAPSYILNGVDRITFNLFNKENNVKLILHFGATRVEKKKGTPILDDSSGLIHWQSDIRGVLSFNDLSDIKTNKERISEIILRWLELK